LEDLGVDGRIILKCIFNNWDESINLNDLAQDRSGSFECGNEPFCFTEGTFFTDEYLLASQEQLHSMELVVS
jgi:hypothetical protein